VTYERRRVLLAFGATIVLTPGPKGMKGAIAKAQQLVKQTPDSWMPAQFDNPANVEVHKRTTAIEVFEATEGRLDAFVCGVGTGGSVTGTGTVLKQKIPGVKIVAVESADSPVLSGQPPQRPNRIQGISAGFVPTIYDKNVVDQIVVVPYETAIEVSRRLCREEGIFVGISAGAVCQAALQVAKELGPNKRVVALLPDLGERYLSHELFRGLDTGHRIIDATTLEPPAPISPAARLLRAARRRARPWARPRRSASPCTSPPERGRVVREAPTVGHVGASAPRPDRRLQPARLEPLRWCPRRCARLPPCIMSARLSCGRDLRAMGAFRSRGGARGVSVRVGRTQPGVPRHCSPGPHDRLPRKGRLASISSH
jgi:hypothetical protein